MNFLLLAQLIVLPCHTSTRRVSRLLCHYVFSAGVMCVAMVSDDPTALSHMHICVR